jgi:hypothetical protein
VWRLGHGEWLKQALERDRRLWNAESEMQRLATPLHHSNPANEFGV